MLNNDFVALSGQVYGVAVGSGSLFVGKTLSPWLIEVDIESGNVVADLIGHSGAVYSLFLWNNLLFSGSDDTTIICWNTENGEIVRSYLGHSGPVYSVAVFEEELYSTAPATDIFKWSINDGTITLTFPIVHDAYVFGFAFRAKELFTGSSDTTVVRWDAVSGEFIFRFTGRNSKIRSVASWKNLIISGGDDAEIRMWDASVDSIDPVAVFYNNPASISVLLVFDDVIYFGDFYEKLKMVSAINCTVIRTFTSNIFICFY